MRVFIKWNIEETQKIWYFDFEEMFCRWQDLPGGGGDMYFKRKAYGKLLEWKEQYADSYAVMLEGARRVGKSTIAEHFAINEYRSYILIDFSNTSAEIRACFDDIHDLDP